MLLCDPLTGLVAYPSFEECLTDALVSLDGEAVHLAIGDVDDLKRYVTECRTSDPASFGHLAGNACMRAVGIETLRWAEVALGQWPFSLCATFGGDEVIVAVAGLPYPTFLASIEDLADRLRAGAPRPCTFAVGTLAPANEVVLDGDSAYARLVAHVDSALFDHKAALRARLIDPFGDVIDAGPVPAPRACAVLDRTNGGAA